jgi:Holliday junction resolvase RusA-like endonuclease
MWGNLVIQITIPRAPSDKKLYRTYSGRIIKSAEYRNWISECLYKIRDQIRGKSCIKGDYACIFTIQKPDNRVRDASNLIKASSDILKTSGIVEDDRFMKFHTVLWSPEKGNNMDIYIFHGSLNPSCKDAVACVSAYATAYEIALNGCCSMYSGIFE